MSRRCAKDEDGDVKKMRVRMLFILEDPALVPSSGTRMSASEGECAKMPYNGCVKAVNAASPHCLHDLQAKCR